MEEIHVREGEVELILPRTFPRSPKKMEVFYNPMKRLDRDISVIFLRALAEIIPRKIVVLDLLAASGVRGLRFGCEVDGIERIYLNDGSKRAYEWMVKNWKRNKQKLRCEVKLLNEEANKLLHSLNEYFDYIDVDPFGSPNPFLEASMLKIRRRGILAVTATDTPVLYGVRKKACLKGYFSLTEKTPFMREVGVRILCKRIIEVGAQHEFAMYPIFAHAEKHYLRIYFQKELGAQKALRLLEQCGFLTYCENCLQRKVWYGFKYEERCECGAANKVIGPIFLGEILNPMVISKMLRNTEDLRIKKLLEIAAEETNVKIPYHYITTEFSSKFKLMEPKVEELVGRLKEIGEASRTIFSPKGFRTNLEIKRITEQFFP
ncbi:MAG: hypothetical protein OH339_00325 [Candidatus Parvarchaeota archaeon]|nr:hypothetical protein [Candidatus Haiyanarchaeum thermophilum]